MPTTTTTQRAGSRTTKPSAKQLTYLRTLALRTGQTFQTPATWWQASAEIDRLKKASPTPAEDLARERHEISDAMATERGDAAQITPNEIEGHGARASYAGARTTILVYRTAFGDERKIQTRRNDDQSFRVFDRGPGTIRTAPDSFISLGLSLTSFAHLISLIAERIRDHATEICYLDERLPEDLHELV
jgi:hypothetical protein